MSNIILNMLNCNSTLGNTGMQNCPFDPKELSGLVFVPAGTEITPAQQIVLQTTILAGINNDNPLLRWYPFQTIWELEDNSTDSQTETSNYGGTNYLADGKPAFKFLHKHGVTMNKLYRKAFHLQQNRYDVFMMDKKTKTLIGYSDGSGNLRGFDLEMLSIETWKAPQGTANTSMYSISIALADATQWNDDISALELPSTLNVNQIVGLRQVYLNNATTAFDTGVATIQVLGSTTNLYDTYSADLIDTSIWSATNSAGANIPITSITADAGLKGVEITLNVASGNYPATAGGVIIVNFGSVSDLIANNMPQISEATLITSRS